jgi:hypothetical protein
LLAQFALFAQVIIYTVTNSIQVFTNLYKINNFCYLVQPAIYQPGISDGQPETGGGQPGTSSGQLRNRQTDTGSQTGNIHFLVEQLTLGQICESKQLRK